MLKLRFSLRQLLIGLVVVAVILVGARYSVRSSAVTAGLLAMGIAAIVLLLANLLIYATLRVFGQFFESDGGDELPGALPPIRTDGDATLIGPS